jgi:hypothetical protein
MIVSLQPGDRRKERMQDSPIRSVGGFHPPFFHPPTFFAHNLKGGTFIKTLSVI